MTKWWCPLCIRPTC